MRLARGSIAGVVVALALVATPARATPELERYDRLGISFEYPSAWFVTTEPLSNGSDPDYRFAASTVPVRRTRRDIGPCLPGIERQLPRGAALVFLREYRGASRRRALPRLDPLPRRFRLTHGGRMCGFREGRGDWISFRAADRAFVLGIHVRPGIKPRTTRELRRLVASLRIRPT